MAGGGGVCAITSSRAKKVRWSQRQVVLLPPNSVEQPLEDQSPDDPGEEEGESRGGDGNIGKQRGGEGREREERGPERKERGEGPCGWSPVP